MRSPATSSPRSRAVASLFVAIALALGFAPAFGAQAAVAIDQASDGEAALVADALAGTPSCFVSRDVPLAGDAEPVIGSFIVDGMAYAVTSDDAVELVAVAPSVLADALIGAVPVGSDGAPSTEGVGSGAPASPSPSPEGEPSDGSESEESSEPAAFDVPESVEHDGAAYSVSSIGPRAFAGCDADVVRIPAAVASVDEAAFRGSAVAAVEVADGNSRLSSYDGMLFDADMTCLLLVPEGKQGAARIPKAAEVVPADAFSHCASVTAIEADAGSAAFSSRNGCLYDAAGMGVAVPATDAAAGEVDWGSDRQRPAEDGLTVDDPAASNPERTVRKSMRAGSATFYAGDYGLVYILRTTSLVNPAYVVSGSYPSKSENYYPPAPFKLKNTGNWVADRTNTVDKCVWVIAVDRKGAPPDYWSSDRSGNQPITPGADISEFVEIYAQRGTIVTWDPNHPGGEEVTTRRAKGEAHQAPQTTRAGYRLVGWFSEPDGGEMVCGDQGEFAAESSGMTLYAQWEALGAPIRVSYDLGSEPGGGEAGSWPEGAEPPASLAPDAGLVALPEPVRAGYVLAGWSVKGHPGAELVSRGEGGAWLVDSSRLPECAGEGGAVTLVARWTAKVEVEAPLEATFLYDLARDGAAESSASKDAWSGGAEGASLLRNRSAVPVRVCGMGSVAAEGASVLLGPGGSTLAEAAAGGPKVLSVFPTTDPSTGTRADAEGPATDGEGDDVAHKVDLALGSTLLDDAFASSPDGSPDAGRRAAWTVPAAAPGLNGVPVPGSLKLGFRLNLGGSTGATVDRSALLAATGGDATGTAKVPIAGLSYCFALEGTSKPLPTGSKDDPLWVEVTQEFIDENGLQGSASPGVYGLADIKAAADDLASRVSASTDPNDCAAIEAEAGQSPYWPLYAALMGSQGRDAKGAELPGPYFKLKVGGAYHDVHILGICQDVRGDTGGRAGLTFSFRSVFAYDGVDCNGKNFETNIHSLGELSNWTTSELRPRLRDWMNDELDGAMLNPKTGIVPVVKFQQGPGKGKYSLTTDDTVWIPSIYEVFGSGYTGGINFDTGYLDEIKYEKAFVYMRYQGRGDAIHHLPVAKRFRGREVAYWARTNDLGRVSNWADGTKESNYMRISASGGCQRGSLGTNSACGVVPCFCL